MSNSIRFLGAAILAWAAVRAVSLGLIPGTQALAFDAEAAQPPKPRLPAIQPSQLPPIEPIAQPYPLSSPAASYGPQVAYAGYGGYPAYAPYPVYVPVRAPSGARYSPPQIVYLDRPQGLPAEINVYGAAPPIGGINQPAEAAPPPPAVPARQSTPSFGELKLPSLPDRLSISSWATMRNRAGSDSLASGGMLGGSQAGARLLWRFDPHLSASLRTSAPINSQRGVEAALGLRYQPMTSLPVAITLERRHAFRDYGQSAFALFAEGGFYGRPMPWNSTLDTYLQAGVVDFNHPDWFVDGQAAVSRPVWRNLSAGLGIWGGAQPGLGRLDIGPRATLRLGTRMRVHLDYRYKLIGNAIPGSGGVVTLAGDF
ncbi:hypothetical protein [Sphingomonas sp.]|uniref:hypothetical protein n=1 Tax=Sphingomonas sp. TaxID=28214 RepID=UPI0025F76920|nr:hypothetical protein [Sphingomonas sp.]